jgi:hypothetical protein
MIQKLAPGSQKIDIQLSAQLGQKQCAIDGE